jgi:hypothetical protein
MSQVFQGYGIPVADIVGAVAAGAQGGHGGAVQVVQYRWCSTGGAGLRLLWCPHLTGCSWAHLHTDSSHGVDRTALLQHLL